MDLKYIKIKYMCKEFIINNYNSKKDRECPTQWIRLCKKPQYLLQKGLKSFFVRPLN
jgi:hypothetical protein